MLAENSRIAENNYLLVADIDIERIQSDRLKGKTYQDCAGTYGSAVSMRQILIPVSEAFESDGSLRSVNPHPFTELEEDGAACYESDRNHDASLRHDEPHIPKFPNPDADTRHHREGNPNQGCMYNTLCGHRT